jgi:hypothetical protein
MKPFLHLNLDHPVLKDTFVLPPAQEPDKGYWHYYQKIPVKDTIHPVVLNKLSRIGLFYPHGCLLFYAPPRAKLKLHKDSDNPDTWAINWALTPNRAEMIWYTTNGAGEKKVVYGSTTPTAYTSYQEHEVTEICREEIGYPTIVKIGQPHGGYNPSDQGSWLLSLRFRSSMTWDQATVAFSQFIKT